MEIFRCGEVDEGGVEYERGGLSSYGERGERGKKRDNSGSENDEENRKF